MYVRNPLSIVLTILLLASCDCPKPIELTFNKNQNLISVITKHAYIDSVITYPYPEIKYDFVADDFGKKIFRAKFKSSANKLNVNNPGPKFIVTDKLKTEDAGKAMKYELYLHLTPTDENKYDADYAEFVITDSTAVLSKVIYGGGCR